MTTTNDMAAQPDPLRFIRAVPTVMQQAMMDSDMSLLEWAAVFRCCAEACSQAQAIQEVSLLIAKQRGKP